MTLAERVIYEREHGKGSAPEPRPQSAGSIDELKTQVETKMRDALNQQAEIDARKRRVEQETKHIEAVKREIDGDGTPAPSPNQDHESGASRHSQHSKKQVCVSPAFALKQFFSNWSTNGRAARSEVWWVSLFVMMPLLSLEKAITDTALLLVVGVAELVVLWPTACLEGRRFHDLGVSAVVGVGLVVARAIFTALEGYYGSGSLYSLLAGLIGFVLLLANVAQSQPRTNSYGDVPNLK